MADEIDRIHDGRTTNSNYSRTHCISFAQTWNSAGAQTEEVGGWLALGFSHVFGQIGSGLGFDSDDADDVDYTTTPADTTASANNTAPLGLYSPVFTPSAHSNEAAAISHSEQVGQYLQGRRAQTNATTAPGQRQNGSSEYLRQLNMGRGRAATAPTNAQMQAQSNILGQGDATMSVLESVHGTFERGVAVAGANQGNCWTKAPYSCFNVRGKTYLTDSIKTPAQEPMFELIGVDSFTIEAAQGTIAPWRDGVLQRLRRNAASVGCRCARVLIINWMLPGTPNINHVHYFAEKAFTPVTEDDIMYKKMLDYFMAPGNDEFRRKRFKFIPSIVEGPWIVKQSAGSNPALIGKKLDMSCHIGEGYCELSIDVSSSTIAGKVVDLCKGFAKSLVIDMAYTIEGRKEAELPERLLGAVRLHRPDMSNVATGPSLPLPT